MIMDLITTLRQVGNTIYDVVVLPANFLLSEFAAHAPGVAAKLGAVGDDQSDVLPLFLSMLIWVSLAIVVTKIVKLGQNLLRIVSATIRSMSFRISLAIRNLKTRLMCGLRRLIPRRSKSVATASELEFDELDLAVLRFTVRLGPGFATSARELAEQLPLRPAQIQRSLDKLRNNEMLDHVIGSTDGFETYRLSKSGAYFMAMWQRKRRNS
jgi:hypothetical protein